MVQKILTTELINSLITQGYRYCLSRTVNVLGQDADRCIILVPVKQDPLLYSQPEKFNNYFDIDNELHQMARGIDNTLILVDLGDTISCVDTNP
jgi:hypothetical protein